MPGTAASKPVLHSLNNAFWWNLIAGRNESRFLCFMKSLDLWWKHFANHGKEEKSLLWWNLFLSLNFNFLCRFMFTGNIDINSYRMITKYFFNEYNLSFCHHVFSQITLSSSTLLWQAQLPRVVKSAWLTASYFGEPLPISGLVVATKRPIPSAEMFCSGRTGVKMLSVDSFDEKTPKYGILAPLKSLLFDQDSLQGLSSLLLNTALQSRHS